MKSGFLKIVALAAWALATLPGVAHAVVGTYTWDPNLSGGTATGGTGTWNSTNGNWYDSSGSADTTWTSGYSATFDGASPGTVTLGTSESVNNLFFNISGYTITPSGSASTLTLGGSISVVPGAVAVINPTLSFPAVGNLTVIGGGTASLGTALTPSASGTINIGSGTLVLAQTSTAPINFNNGGVLNGNLVVANSGTRVNFNSLVGSTSAALPTVAVYGGSGAIQVQASSVTLSNSSGDYGGAIGAPGGGLQIQLNSLNLPFNKFDVTQAVPAFPATNSFVTAIGATKNGTFNGYLQINAPISGNSDVIFSNSTGGGGAGITFVNAQCTYAGATLIEGNGGETAGYTGGSLVLGTSNALPVATDVEFGDINGKPSNYVVMDVNGYNQQIGSLSSNAASLTYAASRNFYIANNAVGTLATLTVSGNTTPNNAFGGHIVDHSTTTGGTLALVKDGTNTLVLSNSNSYSGGTVLNGGVLDIANSAGSALGSGSLTLNGGTLEADPGSIAGSVFAGTGPHTIAPGRGLGGIATLVLGGSLNLNGNSTLDFDISGGSSDLLQIGGSLGISSPVTLDVNASGTLSGPYTLATYAPSAGIVPADFDVPGGLPAGYTLQASSTQLSITSVPEPSTLVLAIGGAILGLVGYKRRPRSA